jgi:hypothetical protein
MISERFFKLSAAYKNFINARGCPKINSYPGVFQLISALAFGGCGLNKDTLNQDLQKIMSLDRDELLLLGINAVTYPFLLIAIHKSIIYGKMEYTDELINIARRVINNSEVFYEDWLYFYEKVYNELSNIVKNTKDKDSYSQAIKLLSQQVACNDTISKYKCKVIAILGDLQKYDEIRDEKESKESELYRTIDSDLNYISREFEYDDKLETYKNALTSGSKVEWLTEIPQALVGVGAFYASNYFHIEVNVQGVLIFLSFFISSNAFRKRWAKYLESRNRKIMEKHRIIPTLLQLNSKK